MAASGGRARDLCRMALAPMTHQNLPKSYPVPGRSLGDGCLSSPSVASGSGAQAAKSSGLLAHQKMFHAAARCGLIDTQQRYSAGESQVLRSTEVEVKIRLPDLKSYKAVAQALAGGWRQDHNMQDCYFTDGFGRLDAALMALRCRLYGTPKRAVLALKGKPAMKGGIGRAYEIEEDVDALLAETFMAHPESLAALDSQIMKTCRRNYGVVSLTSLGKFRTLRREYAWEGQIAELDMTTYEHGTLYEIEVETAIPGEVRFRLSSFLRGLGISFSYSEATKYGNFMDKTLL